MFDVLAVVSVLAAALALLRVRPATFIFAANQIGVLRALAHIEEFGQPRSQGFLPTMVFSLENVQIARNIFLITTPLLVLSTLLPGPRRRAPVAWPAVPRWLLVVLLGYMVAVILSQRTIFSGAYSDPDRVVYGFTLSGAHAFLASILLYEVVRRVLEGALSRAAGFGFLIGLFFLSDYLKGMTGLATGYMVVAAFLIFGSNPRPLWRALGSAGAVAGLILLAFLVRGVRSSLWYEGMASVTSLVDTVKSNEESVARTGEGAEVFGNGVQYAAHVLECVQLYESGISREWRSVYLPVVYTFQPKFIMLALDLERPKEAAWELADYFVHGGGIYVLGELYWNGGYLCVIAVALAMLAFAWACDTRWRTSFFWLLMMCQFAPNLLQGVGYGFAQVSRGVFNGLIALGCWYLWRRLRAPARVSEAHA